MKEAIGRYKRIEIPTAVGHAVPIVANLINNNGFIMPINIGYEWFKKYDWGRGTEEHKGKWAESIVMESIEQAGFLTPVSVSFLELREEQYQGKDLHIKPKAEIFSVEVKADVPGGIWGTGNLFVQTHERRD